MSCHTKCRAHKNRSLPLIKKKKKIPVFAITGRGWNLSLLGRNSLQSLPAQRHVVEKCFQSDYGFPVIFERQELLILFSFPPNNLPYISTKKNCHKPLLVCFLPSKINSTEPQVYLTNWRSFDWTLWSNSFSSPEAGIL